MSDKVSSAENQQGRLKEKLSPDYIVGLVDGEGYFSVTACIEHYKTYSAHHQKPRTIRPAKIVQPELGCPGEEDRKKITPFNYTIN